MTIDDYLKHVTPEQRTALNHIRSLVKRVVPEATEAISYGMPTLKYKGKYLIYFAAYKDHMSIHGSMTAIEDKLPEYVKSGKGTIQFTAEKLVPDSIIKEFVHYRVNEIEGKSKS